MSNHYNESLRQDLLISKEVGGILSRKMGEALISGALKVPNANVILWNEADLTQALIDSPSTYLTAEQIALGDNALGLGVFDNGAHETAPVNNIKRQFVASVITSPSLVSTLRENPLVLGAKTAQRTFSVARNNSDFSKLPGVAASCDTCSDSKFVLQLFTDVGGNYTGSFSKKKLGFNDDVSLSVGVGANYKVRDNIVLGMNVDYVDTKTRFASKRGKADIKESAVSVHGVYNFEKPMFVYASSGIGNVSYNITRKIALGLTERAEKGKTTGKHLFSTLGTGYNYNMTEDLVATPFVAGHYQSVTMKDYSENNPSSFSSMDFRIPKRESIMAEVGMTVSSEYYAENTKITPSFTASYLYDFKDPIDNRAQGRNLRNYKYFKVPTYSVAKSNIQLQGNVAADISNQYKVNFNAGAGMLGKVKSCSIGLGGAINL
ncbi:MAG: autotransporter outer membrane beta-barrel domain-containing protein [Rickettsiaceae bacterium]|nr:autotransporter outer membrane beta-barrel domain-containing protein [Rickettsiaceae bacterium]